MTASNVNTKMPNDVVVGIYDTFDYKASPLPYLVLRNHRQIFGQIKKNFFLMTLYEKNYLLTCKRQGTTLRLALLPGASSTVKNRVSGKFMA